MPYAPLPQRQITDEKVNCHAPTVQFSVYVYLSEENQGEFSPQLEAVD
jgi:hypothetical protein